MNQSDLAEKYAWRAETLARLASPSGQMALREAAELMRARSDAAREKATANAGGGQTPAADVIPLAR